MQDRVDRVPKTLVDETHVGEVTVEAYTVMHDHDGPQVGLCAVRTPAGARTWGRVTETATAAAMTQTEAIGSPGHLDDAGVLVLV